MKMLALFVACCAYADTLSFDSLAAGYVPHRGLNPVGTQLIGQTHQGVAFDLLSGTGAITVTTCGFVSFGPGACPPENFLAFNSIPQAPQTATFALRWVEPASHLRFMALDTEHSVEFALFLSGSIVAAASLRQYEQEFLFPVLFDEFRWIDVGGDGGVMHGISFQPHAIPEPSYFLAFVVLFAAAAVGSIGRHAGDRLRHVEDRLDKIEDWHKM